VSDLDLSKAIDAAVENHYSHYDEEPPETTPPWLRQQIEHEIRAALPHILEAISENAEADGLDYGYVFEDWLRAKAEEARDD
jgi:hypothetical protein